jgi:hypothetical protein
MMRMTRRDGERKDFDSLSKVTRSFLEGIKNYEAKTLIAIITISFI